MRKDYRDIKIEDYNYLLLESRIAKYPMDKRDESKLLYFENTSFSTYQFKELPELLKSDDLLVFNNAKVIQARLDFNKETGAHIEIFCLEPHLPADYNLAFQVNNECQWKCLVGNLKRWKSGKLSKIISVGNKEYIIEAQHIEKSVNAEIIQFNWFAAKNIENTEKITFGDILENMGSTPLPPYLNRQAEVSDKDRYQTIYARKKGSVAAPTSGLHFTDEVFKSLVIKGIKTENITLHVSAGTFKPVKSQTIDGHEMHEEHFEINLGTLNRIFNHTGRIIAVGTTSARTLESIYRIGVKLTKNLENPFHISQWEVYDSPYQIDIQESIQSIVNYMTTNKMETLKASTSIIIVPGYEFKIIKGLVTNFHQPLSTLLLLIAAGVGEMWHQIYDYALANGYRFLSYGDSSLLILS